MNRPFNHSGDNSQSIPAHSHQKSFDVFAHALTCKIEGGSGDVTTTGTGMKCRTDLISTPSASEGITGDVKERAPAKVECSIPSLALGVLIRRPFDPSARGPSNYHGESTVYLLAQGESEKNKKRIIQINFPYP